MYVLGLKRKIHNIFRIQEHKIYYVFFFHVYKKFSNKYVRERMLCMKDIMYLYFKLTNSSLSQEFVPKFFFSLL